MIAPASNRAALRMGTPVYIPPEILDETGDDGFKKDMWAFGITMYQYITDDRNIDNIIKKNECGKYCTDYTCLLSIMRHSDEKMVIKLCNKFGEENDYSGTVKFIIDCMSVSNIMRPNL